MMMIIIVQKQDDVFYTTGSEFLRVSMRKMFLIFHEGYKNSVAAGAAWCAAKMLQSFSQKLMTNDDDGLIDGNDEDVTIERSTREA